MRLIYGANKPLCEWVSYNLSGRTDCFSSQSVAIGIEEEGKVIAAVVYHNYQETYDNQPLFIEMSIFSLNKRWATRYNLKQLFLYPFAQLRLERVQAICSASDEGVIMFLKKLGFQQEGLHRKAHNAGGDALSFSMLKHECKWI